MNIVTKASMMVMTTTIIPIVTKASIMAITIAFVKIRVIKKWTFTFDKKYV
jgi:hypothetical protein